MLPIDSGDGLGSVTPAPPLPDILPAQAMARGGTIIRPGAVAWGGIRSTRDEESSSGEAIERVLTAVLANPGRLPVLLAELRHCRLWVPLPARRRPFTDGTAVRLPVVSYDGTDFVPCFTSAQRLTAWSATPPATPAGDPAAAPGGGRRWQRAGDTRVVPHIVVPAAGLARRLPPGLGLALNPNAIPGVPLYPECVSYLARTTPDAAGETPAAASRVPGQPAEGPASGAPPAAVQPAPAAATPAGPPTGIGHPPVEPVALLREACAALSALPAVRAASRAWLSPAGRGEGLIIAAVLDDPASEPDRQAVVDALGDAVTRVPLRVPFPVDVTFPGESAPDMLDDWITRNTRPFYTRNGDRRAQNGPAD